MARTEEYRTVIKLNSDQAKKEIDALDRKVTELKKKQSSFDKESKQYQKLEKEINKNVERLGMMRNRLDSVKDALRNMSNATPKQLKDTIKDINKLLNSGNIKRGSQEWKELTAALKQANTELSKIKMETQASEPALGRFFNFLNKSWGSIFILMQSISGLTMTVRRSVEDFAKMEEEMADVRKYTGLTSDEVRELNEELKKMDTRTSREELNQLAGAAGRLGISSKQDIMEFVEAADMIGVALGDDLGDGAVDKIGKLAMAFGEDDKKGLKGAMLATGSALNELAQNSSAQAGYLVDFTARVAGFAKQLGLTQAQIMGFATVMDENLLRDEMAATAFGNMLTKMQLDTAKFAKMAGKDVTEFSELLRTDANAAVLALADSLKKADPQEMMKMLTDMGLDGSRAVGVLATMADKIDDVRKHQERATEAYEKATSVQGEFSVMNNTVQARIDKCKKAFNEMAIELGEKLLPVVQYTITGAGMMTKTLSTLIGFVSKYRFSLITLTATIGALVLAKEADVLITKAEIIWNEKLVKAWNASIAACKRLWAAIVANPYLAAAAAAMALLGVVVDLMRRTKEAAREESLLNKVRSESKVKIVEEQQKLELLVKASKDEKVSKDERMKAINELNKIIPGYITQLDKETGAYVANKKALDDYLNSLARKYELEGAKDALRDLGKQIADTTIEINKATEDAKKAKELQAKVGPKSAYSKEETMFIVQNTSRAEKAVSDGNRKMEKLLAQRKQIFDAYGVDLLSEASSPAGEEPSGTDPKSGGGGKGGGGSKKDPFDEDLKLLENAYKNRQLLAKKHLADGLLTEQQFQDLSYDLEMQHLADKLELQKKYGKETADTEIQMLDKTMDQARKMQQRSAQAMQDELKAVEDAYSSDRTELTRMRAEGEIRTEKEYQNRLKEQELDYLRQRLAIVRRYGGDTIQEEKAILDKQVQDVEEFRKQMTKAYEKAYSQAATLEDQRTFAQMMYDQQLIDFEDYQQRMTEIEAIETQKRNDVRQQFFDMGQQLLYAASSYAQACSDLETAKITADYERQIAAAGKNTKKREKLEKERDEKLRKQKNESNQRAMKIEVAQAIATTASNALGAFGAVLQPQMPWTVPLAYIAAAAATANGLLQIATIKKQHQAEAAGYYEGGFTGGTRYRREAGVVHEGEFVANHQSVSNPAILPFLNFLDQAQRNNTVGSLTAQDVSRTMGAGGAGSVIAPIVNVQTDNSELRDELQQLRETNEMLRERLRHPIDARVSMQDLDEQSKRYNDLMKSK